VPATKRPEIIEPEPDLVAAAAPADELQAANAAARKKARDEWLPLCATLRVDRKAVAREFPAQRLHRSEKFRQRLLRRFGEPRG